MLTNPVHRRCSKPRHVSLEPLLALGRAALAPQPAVGIQKVLLREVAIAWDNVFQEVLVRRAGDLFACQAAAGDAYDLVPRGARIVWAVFAFYLADSPSPCLVEIWPPAALNVSRASAAQLVRRWCLEHGFMGATPIP